MLGNASNFSVLMNTIDILLLLLIIIVDAKKISSLEDKVDKLMKREDENNG